MSDIKTKKDIKDCCGKPAQYYETSTHQQISCKVCGREEYVRHGYVEMEDYSYGPDYALHRLVTAWNGGTPLDILDKGI